MPGERHGPVAPPGRHARRRAVLAATVGRGYHRVVEIDYALIADHADIAGGKLYLNGGGWDRYSLVSAPGAIRLAVAVGIRIAWEETNRPVAVRVVLEDDDGAALVTINGTVRVGRPPDLPPGSSQSAHMAANVHATIPRFGGYRIAITVDEPPAPVLTRTLPFRVTEKKA